MTMRLVPKQIRSRKLHVALLAPVQERIPSVHTPSKMGYGGSERVVACLAYGFGKVAKVSLFAAGNSSSELGRYCDLYPTVPEAIRTLHPYNTDVVAREKAASMAALTGLLRAEEMKVDIIHNHIGPEGLIIHRAMRCKIPMVTTAHGHLGRHDEMAVFGNPLMDGYPIVSISNSQRRAAPNFLYAGTVYNPIPDIFVPRLDDEQLKEKTLVWIGRFSPEKAPHLAIKIAAALNMKLILAGKRESHEVAYFNDKVQPLLDKYPHLVTLLGEVNDVEKTELMRKAFVFLMPIQWDEPFGLVVAEALRCGTPVVASDRGAMKEIIVPGTGFCVRHRRDEEKLVEQFVKRVKQCSMLKRSKCVENSKRFSVEAAAKGYMDVFETILSSQHSNRVLRKAR